MTGRVRLFLVMALGGLALLLICDGGPPPREAAAQGLFDRLFGPPPGREPPRRERRREEWQSQERPAPRQRRARQRRAPPADPQPALVEVLPKHEDALKLLVVGDFFAGALARGLDQAFAEEPRIAVIDRSQGDSGLARPDRQDWVAALPAIVEETAPHYVVVMLGGNDRQNLRGGEERLRFRSPEWEAEYRRRVAGIADTLAVWDRPAFWVGLPPIDSREGSADYAWLNRMYEVAIEAAGGRFVDVWDGFADADGGYIRKGPDLAGEVRNLRVGDGINFTRSGERKLAFYVDREIRLPGNGAADTFLASESPGDRIEVLPDGRRLLVGPVISLSDAPPGAPDQLIGGELASAGAAAVGGLAGLAPPSVDQALAIGLGMSQLRGGAVPAALSTPPAEESPRYRLVVRGEALPPVAGRVDDFRWPAADGAEMATP